MPETKIMEYFNEGLVTKSDPQTENRNLFYAEYLTLGGVDQGFNSFMHEKQLPNGLYLRSSIHTNRTVSHDEITGWLVSSKILGTCHGEVIWSQLVRHYGAYPAAVKNWTDYLPFNPGNYYAWAKLVGSKASIFFFPIYLLNLVISCSKPPKDTSSKIIYWLELSNINSPLCKWFFEKRMKSQYGDAWLSSLLIIYFGTDSEFPLLKQLRSRNVAV